VTFDVRYGFSIDTIGPLQFEYVLALIVATGVARLAALGTWTIVGSITDSVRRAVYGGVIFLVIALIVLALPSLILGWLYSLTHPGAFICTFLVWPGLLLPLAVYCVGVVRLIRRERRENTPVGAH
jgi:hypothetical protein